MELKDFDRVRVGSGFPASFDVAKIEEHESWGVFATAYTYRTGSDGGYLQLRSQGCEVALFNFSHKDMQPPKGWRSSSVLWDSRNEVND